MQLCTVSIDLVSVGIISDTIVTKCPVSIWFHKDKKRYYMRSIQFNMIEHKLNNEHKSFMIRSRPLDQAKLK